MLLKVSRYEANPAVLQNLGPSFCQIPYGWGGGFSLATMNGKKINGIRQIVRLRQLVKKWHALALTRKPLHAVGCSLSPKFKQRSALSRMYDSDEECPGCPPPDVPEGYLAVYVGRERRRFIIPTCYLSRPAFRTLLQKAEEEFGFDHKGGLTIPCDTAVFDRVLWVCERNDPEEQKTLSLDDLSNIEADSIYCGSQAHDFYGAFPSSKACSRASLQKSFG